MLHQCPGKRHPKQKKSPSPSLLQADHPPPSKTFREFVSDILNDREKKGVYRNPHWSPQWIKCRVCKFTYHMSGEVLTLVHWCHVTFAGCFHPNPITFPGHMETLEEDADYVARVAGANFTLARLNARNTR